MFIIQILPEIFSLFKSAPLYQFTRNSYYIHSKKTSKNNIQFFVNDKFLQNYPENKDYLSIEKQIEKE